MMRCVHGIYIVRFDDGRRWAMADARYAFSDSYLAPHDALYYHA